MLSNLSVSKSSLAPSTKGARSARNLLVSLLTIALGLGLVGLHAWFAFRVYEANKELAAGQLAAPMEKLLLFSAPESRTPVVQGYPCGETQKTTPTVVQDFSSSSLTESLYGSQSPFSDAGPCAGTRERAALDAVAAMKKNWNPILSSPDTVSR